MTSLKLYNIIKHRLHVCFKESYNRKVPPFTVHPLSGSMVPVQVQVSTTLMNVLAVSEFTHTIDLKLGRHLIISRIHSILLMENSPFGISKFYIRWTILGITLNWYENRVFYNNLKSEEALNVMSDEEVCYILHIYALYIDN